MRTQYLQQFSCNEKVMAWSIAKKALIRTDSPVMLRADPSLEGADPELCISLLERGLNFSGLKHRLREADQKWMEQFLSFGGLSAIFEALQTLGERGFASIAEALRQLECVACVKAVMNNRFGLEFIIHTPGEKFVQKLAQGGYQCLTRIFFLPKINMPKCISFYSNAMYDHGYPWYDPA